MFFYRWNSVTQSSGIRKIRGCHSDIFARQLRQKFRRHYGPTSTQSSFSLGEKIRGFYAQMDGRIRPKKYSFAGKLKIPRYLVKSHFSKNANLFSKIPILFSKKILICCVECPIYLVKIPIYFVKIRIYLVKIPLL